MTLKRDEFLNHLFGTYRDLLGAFEPTPAFNAKVWARIEARKRESLNWASYLIAWSPRLAFAAVLLAAALLVAAPWMGTGADSQSALLDASYVDMLALESMDDQGGALLVLAENGR